MKSTKREERVKRRRGRGGEVRGQRVDRRELDSERRQWK